MGAAEKVITVKGGRCLPDTQDLVVAGLGWRGDKWSPVFELEHPGPAK